MRQFGLAIATCTMIGMVGVSAMGSETLVDPLQNAYAKCSALSSSNIGITCQLAQVGKGEFVLFVIATTPSEFAAAKAASKEVAGLACMGNTVEMTLGYMLTTVTANVITATCDPPGPKVRDVTNWHVISTR